MRAAEEGRRGKAAAGTGPGKRPGPVFIEPPKLHKALADAGFGSRRELEELFEADAGEGTLGRIVERKD